MQTKFYLPLIVTVLVVLAIVQLVVSLVQGNALSTSVLLGNTGNDQSQEVEQVIFSEE